MLQELFDFIWESPSPYHAVEQTRQLLAGSSNGGWSNGGSSNSGWSSGGTAIAALAADNIDPAKLHFRIIGAHTDSPNLRIKPRPDMGKAGYRQLAVEPYGGVLLNSWFDRDLGLSGRVTVRSSAGQDTAGQSGNGQRGAGGLETHRLKLDEPLLRVPQLAIHLDREISKTGFKLTAAHLNPVWSLGELNEGGFSEFLAERLSAESGQTGPGQTGSVQIEPDQIVSWDLMAHDLTPPSTLGRDGEFYAAARIDNLASCHAAATALASLQSSDLADNAIAVIVLYDHEEVGSGSATGAASPVLQHYLERTALSFGADRDQFLAALQRSICVSADGAHAVHPNYLDRHDANHHVHLNGGPVIKLNTNQRYATDSNTSAIFQSACRAAGVECQFYSHQNDLPCGSTIGPITATQLGISVVDVGSAQLSMHSAREMGGSEDPAMLTAALREFLRL